MVYEISPSREDSTRGKDNSIEKITDNYIYNISHPTTCEDISKFEIDNQVSVFVYYINDDDSIRTEKRGNPDYILNDVIYLLRVENDDNAHYIYIKHLERLFNTHKCSQVKGTKLFPLCEKNINEQKNIIHIYLNAINSVKKEHY